MDFQYKHVPDITQASTALLLLKQSRMRRAPVLLPPLQACAVHMPGLALPDYAAQQRETVTAMFETTIRYMAGMLRVYELRGERLEDRALVDKRLGIMTPIQACRLCKRPTSNIAEAGTLILEWATLRKHLNDSKDDGVAEKSFRHIVGMVCRLVQCD
ncbi:hypothetical protein BDZ89DRAFT_1137536 [Hymenopellis radicata]|nr:hypothetical protein BDZ89DRAFT_1137536 [Hymenopellis radicata]